MITNPRLSGVKILVGFVAAELTCASLAHGAELRVGPGETYATIAAAIAAAQHGDTILVTAPVHTENQIIISKSVTITGQGMTNTIVQAAAARSNATYRIFTVTANGLAITVQNMTLRHGYTINDSEGARGAAFYSTGASTTRFANCFFTANDTFSRQYARGGAIYVRNADAGLSVSNCWFFDNTQNGTDAGGGAIAIDRASWALIENCTFASNSAQLIAGAVWMPPTSLLSPGGAPLVVRNCTFWNNRTRTSSTTGGGAIYIGQNSATLDHVTIITNIVVGSGGGGVANTAAGSVIIRNSIIAHNVGGASNVELYNDTNTLVATNCLILGTCSASAMTNGCITGVSPRVSPPAFNGGPTPTCALQADSPCLDQGSNPLNLAYDQRGPGFPRVWIKPDMGAYELVPPHRALGYTTNILHEWYANNGTINNDLTPRIALANDTFTGSDGEDFVAGGKATVGNVPAGLTAAVVRTNAQMVALKLLGTASSHTSADNIDNLTVTFSDSAFTGGDAAGVSNSVVSNLAIRYLDSAMQPVITYEGVGYWETGANRGAVSNTPVVARLQYEYFTGTNGQNLAADGRVTAANVPSGLTLVATKVDDGRVDLYLAGEASLPHNASNSVENLIFEFQDSAFYSQPASSVSNATKGGFYVRFHNPRITYSATTFNESAWNDGSIIETSALTLLGDVLTGTNGEDFVASAKVWVTNLPAGLTAVVTRVTVTNLTARFAGNALQHEWAHRVTNLTFAFQNSAFAYTPASVVTNALMTNLTINFMTNPITYYVATNGNDMNSGLSWATALATITQAVAKCRAAASDIVQIGTGVFYQTRVGLGKAVIVRGMGPSATILQGGTSVDTNANRFFTTSGGNNLPITIRDMTLLYGGTNGNGGAIYGGSQSPLYVVNCHVVSNIALGGGGAIYLHDNNGYYGQLFVSNCLFVGNQTQGEAGAIRSVHWSRINLYGSSFIENMSKGSGGAINSQVSVLAQNCTFWGNTSTNGSGGAIYHNGGGNEMDHCTVTSNRAYSSGGAFYANAASCTMTIRNSIIGTNATVTDAGSTLMRPPNGVAYTVSNSLLYGTYQGATVTNCILQQNPKVLPPADNGGPTPTCAIAADSPARNAANPATALALDQRGYVRDSQPDMGAFEFGAKPADWKSPGTVFLIW